MRTILVALFFVFAFMGCGFNPPCQNNICIKDPSGPPNWQQYAQNIWDYYHARTGASGPKSPPFDVFHWYFVGDCPASPGQFVAEDGSCVAGDTIVWDPVTGSYVSDIFIMDVGVDNGVIHHELLHTWLALSGMDPSGDQYHTRSEWTTLLPDAQRDVVN